MLQQTPTTCENAPWYQAPVIVGGSGGSGTRGVALLLESLGVRMACVGEPLVGSSCRPESGEAGQLEKQPAFQSPL